MVSLRFRLAHSLRGLWSSRLHLTVHRSDSDLQTAACIELTRWLHELHRDRKLSETELHHLIASLPSHPTLLRQLF